MFQIMYKSQSRIMIYVLAWTKGKEHIFYRQSRQSEVKDVPAVIFLSENGSKEKTKKNLPLYIVETTTYNLPLYNTGITIRICHYTSQKQ